MKSRFNTGSIKGRTLLLIIVFLILLTFVNIFVLSQNHNVQKLGKGVKDLTLPLTLNGQEILLGLNKASAVQRAYYISRNDSLIFQREQIWQNDILPALAILVELGKDLERKENIERIERLKRLVPQYQGLQQEIEESMVTVTSPTVQMDHLDTIGHTQETAHVLAMEKKAEQEREFSRLVTEKIDPIKARIEDAIDPLLASERQSLEDNIGELNSNVERTSLMLIVLSLIGLVISLSMAYFLFKRLGHSISGPTDLLHRLSQGDIPDKLPGSTDELNEVIKAGNILAQNLAAASKFAGQIGEGDLEGDYSPAGQQDILGNALVRMRDRLKQVAGADKEQQWTANGLNSLGTLLRKDHSDLEDLGSDVLKFLVKYMDANQGVLFILNDKDKGDVFMELGAMYAWGRVKHTERKIRQGEGLVGQVWQEGSTTYMEAVPESYVNITSGLGGANPRSIIVLPLKFNERVYGILELASFKKYWGYQLRFLEDLAGTIASTISTTRNNEHTKRLLEQAQETSVMVRAQEEEMRQSMEELEATQEAMKKKQKALENANKMMKQNEELTKKALAKKELELEEYKKLYEETLKG